MCVSLHICVHARVWQSSKLEDHPQICYIPQGNSRKGLVQICMKEPRLKNKRQEQEGDIFSRAACVSVRSPLLKCLFSTFKAFATGNLNELCALQHVPTESRGRKNTDLKFAAFPVRFFNSENYTSVTSHSTEHSLLYYIKPLWRCSQHIHLAH